MDRKLAKFPLQVATALQNRKKDPKFAFLKDYQDALRYYCGEIIPQISSCGILVYHGMGSGKSISAVAIAMDQIASSAYKKIIFLMSRSLQENMKSAIHQYITFRLKSDPEFILPRTDIKAANAGTGQIDEFIEKNFIFISLNASNMIQQMRRVLRRNALGGIRGETEEYRLDGYSLLCDEAHNLFRAIVNGSKNGSALYDIIMKSDQSRIFLGFFTGTPINNHPFELCACFNMLEHGSMPESYFEFITHYMKDGIGVIKNKGKFQNRIFGLLSYISVEGLTSIPEKLPAKVHIVPMDDAQYTKYKLARDLEFQEEERTSGKGNNAAPNDTPSMQKPDSGGSSSYRSKSRQISNYASPFPIGEEGNLADIPADKIHSNKFDTLMKAIDAEESKGLVYSQYTGAGGIGAFARFLEARGWEEWKGEGVSGSSDFDYMEKMEKGMSQEEYIGALENILTNAKKEGGKAKDNDPVGAAKGTAMEGMATGTVADKYIGEVKEMDKRGKGKGQRSRKFAIISGAVDFDYRKQIEQAMNADDNMRGENLALILVSSTGAEGLDFRALRHVHIMEPYWNYLRAMQVSARAIRTHSHDDVPEKERKVQIHMYISVEPNSSKDTLNWDTGEMEHSEEGKETEYLREYMKKLGGTSSGSTEVALFLDSIDDYIAIMSFLRAMQEVSIECGYYDRGYCRLCAPSSAQLYTNSVARDVSAPDPCTDYKAQSVSAKKVDLGEKGIFYYDKENSSIYRYDQAVDAYREVPESDDVYFDVLDKVKK